MTSDIIAALILVPLNLGALYVLGYGLRDLYRGWQSTRYERAPGKLIQSEVKETVHKNRRSSRTVHQVELKYEYMAGGRPYEGTVIAPSYCPTQDRQDHEDLLEWLKSTPQFTVFYDPVVPERSVLIPGVDLGMLSQIAIGVLLLSITLGIAIGYFLIAAGDPGLVHDLVVH
ncbi:DUF3592 domain-containing protein [Bremerella cremea]|uniref:DUF3592 domain-containing protein n=1 Tax=Bremerella cremea TaxID=1031537 RepID=UPI0031E8B0EA